MIDWSAVAAIISAVTLLLLLIGGGVLWGTLTQKVANLEKRDDSHESEFAGVASRLNSHDIDLAMLKEWKNGFNAAVRIGAHTPELT